MQIRTGRPFTHPGWCRCSACSPGCSHIEAAHGNICKNSLAFIITLGVVQVRASSPSCRNTDPKAVVSGLFLRNNFAGPRYEDGQLQSWWLVDLGPGHRLIINYYTLRHDGSQDFLRNWVLEVGCAQAQHASLVWAMCPRYRDNV